MTNHIDIAIRATLGQTAKLLHVITAFIDEGLNDEDEPARMEMAEIAQRIHRLERRYEE